VALSSLKNAGFRLLRLVNLYLLPLLVEPVFLTEYKWKFILFADFASYVSFPWRPDEIRP
jgi:hypothetical protein